MLFVLDMPFPMISVRPNMPDLARLADELTDGMQLCHRAVERPRMTTGQPSVVRVWSDGEALAPMNAPVRRGLLGRAAPSDGATSLLPWVNFLVCWVARAGPYVDLLVGAHWAHAAIAAMPQRIRGWMIELMMHVPATHEHPPRPADAPLARVADLAVATAEAAFEAIIDWYTLPRAR